MRQGNWCGMTGKMDRRVTFKSCAETQNDSGEPVKTYTTAFEAWAYVRELKGKERFTLDQEAGQAEAVFVIRAEDRVIRPNMLIVYDGREWEVCAPPVVIGAKHGLEVYAKVKRYV